MLAGYVRVSTEDQSVDRQLDSVSTYAEREFDSTLDRVFRDKSTGTDTSRRGYQDMMDSLGELDAVVVHSISRICRSIQDLEITANKMANQDVQLHVVSEGLQLHPEESDPYQTALFQLLGVFAELEANITQQRVREGIAARQDSEDYHHGRPPLGFDKENGRLIQGERYHDVVATLSMIQDGTLSKRKAAQELDTSRATIDRALERQDLYGI